ncbi:MAG: ribosome recycling factor [Rhodobiaceae bacterium]|jgi:ribosome recycling factor|nr:ribosome recycling factor [Rhodobiaceae bacterium]MBT5640816.1 ribosome recycling factor [Rhodobiaceae bacterium]MBT6222957.1 ribosome recycling factor [Rhodobiaceae bacterium]|tara:strand:+ start:1922 stop:2488 length:567 start_codon:yes stop_codon:yes gene_type:complete
MTEINKIDIEDLKRRMTGGITSLKNDFAGLRTGRASASLLDPITIDAYGSKLPINQLSTISVPEPRSISVQVWDKTQLEQIEKAIRISDLGLNPMIDGQLIRIPLPELNTERRQELSKIAAKYAENTKISIRNVRRDGMDKLKKLEKNSDISKDENKTWGIEIQVITDSLTKEVDELYNQKVSEIMNV